jgi:RNA polymerase sigma-B factor
MSSLAPRGARGAHEPNSVARLLEEYAGTRAPELREKLVVLHLDLVSRLARQLAGRGRVIDDLIQVGYIGLMKAIDRFEPGRNVAFAAYAIPTIAGEMKRYLRDKEPIIRIPRQIQEDRQSVERATEKLTQRLHRPPTDAEVAAELRLDPQRLSEIRASERVQPVSLDRPVPSDTEEAVTALGEALAEDDSAFGESEDRLLLEQPRGLLSAREREILDLVFVEGLSQAEVAQRKRISQMQVSRLYRAALARLREGLQQAESSDGDVAKPSPESAGRKTSRPRITTEGARRIARAALSGRVKSRSPSSVTRRS